MKTTFFTLAALLLTAAGSFYACQEKEAEESNEPVVISFTEYSLTGTPCQWANLNYDNKVIVINSSTALESYLTSTRSSYPAIDFSKHSLLLASGTANNAVFGISAKDLQQLVSKDYELSIEIILNPAIVNGQWVFALLTDKLNGDKKVELNASYKNCEDCDDGGDGDDGCEFENPLSDLPWLKAIIDNFEDEAETLGYNPHARIYQCSYNAGTGFLLEMCVGCPGEGYNFRNCEGAVLCSEGNCSELNIDFETKKLIWEKEALIKPEEPCYCIMDTLKGEWSWFQSSYSGDGGFLDDEFSSIVKILSQNEDGVINYEVMVADTLFSKGSFQLQDATGMYTGVNWGYPKSVIIELPHQFYLYLNHKWRISYGHIMPEFPDKEVLSFWIGTLPFIYIAPTYYHYEKIR